MEVNGQIQFTIVSQSAEEVVAEMPVQAGILNPYGTVHAGATLWFADVTATMLALEGVEAEPGMPGFPLAINLNANLLGNSQSGCFTAVARYVKKGRSVSVIRTQVTSEAGKAIADVTTSHVAAK